MKQTLTYMPHAFGAHSCRLRVEGLPDVSSDRGSDALGIITGWCLDWVGHPQLEGRREHLQALISTVIPYARHLLSGIPRAMGGENDPVHIGPQEDGRHHMELRSSQPDIPPLEVTIDDAELADLVRVLDQCRLDPRIQLPLPVPEALPLPARELRHRVPLRRRLSAPVGGLAALAVAAGAGSLLPTPRSSDPPQIRTPTAKTAPADTVQPRLSLLRSWLERRTPRGTGQASQTWQLAVNTRGEVVAASAVEGTDGTQRARLGLPIAEVSSSPSGDTLLVRGVLKPSGFWELSPWHGW
ncbi:MAG: DUF4335 domain-containing protein [Cyanobium sp.]